MKYAAWFSCLFLISCSSSNKKTESPVSSPSSSGGGYELRIKGKKGDKAQTYYHSHSWVEEFEDGSKTRDHQEALDFVVATEVIDARDTQVTMRTTTIEKDGTSSLHDYAFPEPDEKIDFVYSTHGKVLKADPFPKGSIFYLPPVSLPTKDVKIGDTWTMDHAWISSNEGLPLHLNMVTIFKDVVSCGPFGKCADLEVSGSVDVANSAVKKVIQFESKLWGRMLFSLDKGDVVWSEVRSQDSFVTKHHEMKVLACMISRMQVNGKRDKVLCEPATKMVGAPKLF